MYSICTEYEVQNFRTDGAYSRARTIMSMIESLLQCAQVWPRPPLTPQESTLQQ